MTDVDADEPADRGREPDGKSEVGSLERRGIVGLVSHYRTGPRLKLIPSQRSVRSISHPQQLTTRVTGLQYQAATENPAAANRRSKPHP